MSEHRTHDSVAALLALVLAGCGAAPAGHGAADADDARGVADGSAPGDGPSVSADAARPIDEAPVASVDATVDVAEAPPDAIAEDVAASAAGFTCNLLVGPSPMMQWFDGGFLKYPGIDPTRWELIWVAHHYTDAWGRPGDAAWDTAPDRGHTCARNASAPDRVIFQATQWSHTTAAQWEADLTGIVDNIKAKWPSVKRIELMASTSAPGDVPCPAAGGKTNETIIPAFGYEAIDAMPARFPGLVFALPHFAVPSCSDFIGNGTAPQYAPDATATSGPAVTDVSSMFGAYFASHP